MPAVVHPSRYAALYFPMGLMIGYPSVALGYLATRAGLPVSSAAAMVGVAFFAHIGGFAAGLLLVRLFANRRRVSRRNEIRHRLHPMHP